MVTDLGIAFDKLERVARERVAVTMSTEFSPRGFKMLGGTIDGGPAGGYVPDHILAMNILFFKGAYPELHYIDSYKPARKNAPTAAAEENAPAPDSISPTPDTTQGAATLAKPGTATPNEPATATRPIATDAAAATIGKRSAAAPSEPEMSAAHEEQQLIRWAFITWEPVR
jgi:hypothetical protein